MANRRPPKGSSGISSNSATVGDPHRSVLARFSNLSIATVLPRYSIIDRFPATTDIDDPPPAFDDSLHILTHQSDAGTDLLQQVSSQHLSSEEPESAIPPVLSLAQHSSSSSRGSPRHEYHFTNPRFSTILTTTSHTHPSHPDIAGQADGYNFQYSFPISSKSSWATLQVDTRDSVSGNLQPTTVQPKTPRIWGSETLCGVIQLDLVSSLTIQEISIQVKGKIVTSGYAEGSYTFLIHKHPIWSKSMGNPNNMEPAAPGGKFNGKLQGLYSFPFSFPFPSYVDSSTKTPVHTDWRIFSPNESLAEAHGNQQMSTPALSSVIRTHDQRKKRIISSSFFSPISSSHATDSFEQASTQDSASGLSSSSSSKLNIAESSRVHSGVSAFLIPQSFSDIAVAATVSYELSAVFVHGRFRRDSRIRTSLSYVPSVEPLPMPIRRRQAYEEGALLPAPMSDPNSWTKLPSVSVHGFFNEILGLFGKREVVVDCTIYLANPLSYTRGTITPCYLSLSCTDTQALQALDNPKSPSVRLVRRIRFLTLTETNRDATAASSNNYDAFLGREDFGPGPTTSSMTPQLSADLNNLTLVVHEVGQAVWWIPPKGLVQTSTTRWMEGEIHLGEGLQPSCTCPLFSVEYAIEMYPPASPHFESISDTPRSSAAREKGRAGLGPVLSTQLVEITTLHRTDEPVPVAFSEAPKSRHYSHKDPPLGRPEDK